MYYGKVEPVRHKTDVIPVPMLNPHYTDKRFTQIGARTIYLAAELFLPEDHDKLTVPGLAGIHYNYSDNLYGAYGYDSVQASRERAEAQVGNRNTPAFFELMLQQVYEDETVELQHMMAGVNVGGDGFSYHVYGTTSAGNPLPPQE